MDANSAYVAASPCLDPRKSTSIRGYNFMTAARLTGPALDTARRSRHLALLPFGLSFFQHEPRLRFP